jgi:hypothetical protein
VSLPSALAGQLLIFETVATLVYANGCYRQWSSSIIVTGAGLLLAGVSLTIRIKPLRS